LSKQQDQTYGNLSPHNLCSLTEARTGTVTCTYSQGPWSIPQTSSVTSGFGSPCHQTLPQPQSNIVCFFNSGKPVKRVSWPARYWEMLRMHKIKAKALNL